MLLSFLDIEIDSFRMVYSLPDDKHLKLVEFIDGLCSIRKVTLQ